MPYYEVKSQSYLSKIREDTQLAFDISTEAMANQAADDVARMREANQNQVINGIINKKLGEFALKASKDPENFDYSTQVGFLEHELDTIASTYGQDLTVERRRKLIGDVNEKILKLKIKGFEFEANREMKEGEEIRDNAKLKLYDAL